MSDNYFALLSMTHSFEIDKNQLYTNYIALQQLLHPDKYANKTKAEKLLALEYTSKLNKAYQALNDDKSRAEYLLSLEGIVINQEDHNNVHPEPMMLHEILELSEDPAGHDISSMKEECLDGFRTKYSAGEFESAAQEIIKLQYLSKIKQKELE